MTKLKCLMVGIIVSFITNLIYCIVPRYEFSVAFLGGAIACGLAILIQEIDYRRK